MHTAGGRGVLLIMTRIHSTSVGVAHPTTSAAPVETKPLVAAPTVSAPPRSQFEAASPAATPRASVHQPIPVRGDLLGASVPQDLSAFSQLGYTAITQPTAAQMKGAAAMEFKQGQGQPAVELKAGGKFLLTYDPARTPVTGSAAGFPAYGVTAYVQFQPSGEIVERPALGFEHTPNRILGQPWAAPVLVEIPEGTTGVSIWFKQFSGGDRPPEERYDSNWSQNYNFPVTA